MKSADRELYTASQLVAQLANVWSAVMDHYTRELARQDGYPTQTVGAAIPTYAPSNPNGECDECGDPRPCRIHDIPVDMTRVERYAEQRIRIEADKAQMLDDYEVLLSVVKSMTRRANRAQGIRLEVPRCDSGHGREGYNIPRSEGGWSDPTCTNIPDEGRKTCSGCRHRAERWARKRDEQAA